MEEERECEVEPTLVDLAAVEIIGVSELARRWGVTKQRVSEITAKRIPYWRKLDCGRIWLLNDVIEFEKTWTRQTGVHVDPK